MKETNEMIFDNMRAEFKKTLLEYLDSYKEKLETINFEDFLVRILKNELDNDVAVNEKLDEIVGFINKFNKNLESINEATQNGMSKEKWLANQISEVVKDMPKEKSTGILQEVNDVLYKNNCEIAKELEIGNLQDVEEIRDSLFSPKNDLPLVFGKNAEINTLQLAALDINNATIAEEQDESISVVMSSMAGDTILKSLVTLSLYTVLRKGMIHFVPNGLTLGTIVNVACVAVENVKIISNIAGGKISVTKGIEEMGKVAVSAMSVATIKEKSNSKEINMEGVREFSSISTMKITKIVENVIIDFAEQGKKILINETRQKIVNVATNIAKVAFSGLIKMCGNALEQVQKRYVNNTFIRKLHMN